MSHKGRELLRRHDKSLDCIHCGLCLSNCPTYQQTGNEVASPRGRVYLMRGLAEGRLDLTESFREHMDLCLMCRACETACPSAVDFGRMMEITRHEMSSRGFGSWLGRSFRSFMLRRILPFPGRLRLVAALARLHRRSGISGFLRRSRLTRLMPKSLRSMEANLPDVPTAVERRALKESYPAATGRRRRGRVAVLEGCVMRELFGALNRKTVEALRDRGYEVVVPPTQTCCGALHAHSGDMDMARELARRNVAAFDAADIDYLVLNSAGCGAALKDYAHWLEDDDEWRDRASALVDRVIDITVLFEREKLEPRGLELKGPTQAVYDAPCHLHHAQGCATEPVELMKKVPGLELLPFPGAENCCGAAGIYNLTHPEMSRDILAAKLDQLEASGARLLLTGNPGCILQWRQGIAERGLAVEVKHPVELL